ncbi:zinc-dependent metalloprotease [Dyadobacter arcticus]|uniref:Secretion system C-terminal sorting domain-containing protein n=1 Tax=Dyadobacter arcticus TaxID=1078754 RepID=A0ABX0UR78_9BACT|nr:zinc-dependent metalloprotease [Dyadobacter arcticus]NIJ55471.1 hypothetical protein [Dyadobacter arcticus]
MQAPLEFKSKTSKPLTLEVPLPNGEIEIFNLYESPILAPQIAAKHPDIKTYTGNGTVDKKAVIRISLTSEGFNAIILNTEEGDVYYEKLPGSSSEAYFNYFAKDAPSLKGKESIRCGVKDEDMIIKKGQKQGAANRTLADGDLYEFRLAFASNGEFYDRQVTSLPKTKAKVYAVLVAYANRMKAVFRNELAVDFTLVSDERVVFDNAATDPYTNENDGLMLDQNQAVLDNPIFMGADNYDVGHVFGEEPLGSSAGGIASTPAVCDEFSKGQGVTKEGDLAFYSQLFTDQVLFHETGHQFQMSHSYNSNFGPCTTRRQTTSVEPGSGATLMSYGFICDTEDYFPTTQGGLFLNFHSVNLKQAKDFLSTISCGTMTITTNTAAPVITMPAAQTIPKSTPFSLTGSATDGNGDNLTYSWEGKDVGLVEDPDLTVIDDPTKPPFFRSYPAATSPTRIYPALDGILNNKNIVHGDKLPSVAFVTKHTLTVRDNNAAGGRTAIDSVLITIDGTAGPFLVNNDGPGGGLTGSHLAGSPQVVTWSVNNTNNPAGINCQLVDILLSTDGGLTFPRTLLSATPNTGLAAVIFPLDVNTIKARIKVAASSSDADLPLIGGRVMANTPNIFFDISNVNFGITTALPVTLASFNVELKGKNNASLTWETTEETNNKGFDIEMSPDARNFVKVGFVDGNGDSQISYEYQYSINDLAGGHYYFRLKQLDYDGKFEYSQIRTLEVISSSDILAVYPNPTSGKLKFNPNMHKNQSFSIQVANQSGKVVLSLPASTNYSSGYELDASSLASGLYHIVIKGVNFTENLKFVKL